MSIFGLKRMTVALALIMGGSAQAESLSANRDLCLSRTYSSSHLAKNPDQLVTMIRFSHAPSRYGPDQRAIASGNGGQFAPSHLASVAVAFRGNSAVYEQEVQCQAEGNGYFCGVECDGGSFQMRFKANGSALIDFRKSYGMVLGSSCGEGETYRWIGDGKSDDMLFRLDPAPLSACR